MTTNLWSSNHPRHFWLCQPEPPDDVWQSAIADALPVLGLPLAKADIDVILAQTLGEERFGPNQWTLSFPKRVYYFLKPLLPRLLSRLLRRAYHPPQEAGTAMGWPIEERYVSFVWGV